ncbi:hypothetical protein ACVINW_004878 [Bradyrhizobium sp. USDA 4461]
MAPPLRLGLGVFGRRLPFPPPPTFGPSNSTQQIPMPSMPPIPDSLRYAWIAATLLPRLQRQWMTGQPLIDSDDVASLLRHFGNSVSSPDASKRDTGGDQPPYQPPGQPAGLLGLILKHRQLRQSDSGDESASSSSSSNQNTRELVRVPTTVPSIAQQGARNKSASGGSGRGNNGGKRVGGGDDDDYCLSRKYEEENECHQRWQDGEFAHPDHYDGCKQRAVTRWDMCNRNRGRPAPSEPPRWSPALDEEIYINPSR